MKFKIVIFCTSISLSTLSLSHEKESNSTHEAELKLDTWCEEIYQKSSDRKEIFRHETDCFFFSIGTVHNWIALFYKDKRIHVDSEISSSTFFMKDGERLAPAVGDAGDGRTPGAKFVKTSQIFDALVFYYKIGDNAAEQFIFPYTDGVWKKPKRIEVVKTSQ